MYKRKKAGWVEIANVQPVFDRLIVIYGTKAKVAKALGIHKQGFLHPDKKLIQRKTFNKALDLLVEHEKVDHAIRNITGGVPLEVVEVAELSIHLRNWVVEYLADHPDVRNSIFAGPTKVMAFRSGLNVKTVSMFINNTYITPFVSVYVADKILTGIELQHLLSDGTIKVIPNPSLSMESWVKWMEIKGCI